MKPFLMTVALELGLVAGIVFWADPGRQWHRFALAPVREIARDEAWLRLDSEADIRNENVAYLKLSPPFDVVLFGSSVPEYFYQEMFDARLRFFNAWVSAARIEDFVADWQVLKQLRKTPRNVILVLDPWLFNGDWWPRNASWRSNRRYVDAFNGVNYRSAPRREFEGLLACARELVSYTALVRSVGYLLSADRRAETSKSNLIVKKSSVRGAGRVFCSDGMHPPFETAPPGLAVLDKSPRRLLDNPVVPYLDAYKFDAPEAQLLERLIADMAQNRAAVMLILPPVHPRAWSSFLSGSRESRRDFAKVLRRVAGPSVTICDVANPAITGCSESDYLDAHHFGKACAQRVLKACLGRAPAWRILPAS